MSPRTFHSGVRVFASDQPIQVFPRDDDAEIRADEVLQPQPLPGADREIRAEDVLQPQPVPSPDPEIVTIYVRKGDHPKERLISINPIPGGIEPLDLLDAGFALDGNSATISVDPQLYVAHHHGKNAIGSVGLVFPGNEPHVVSFRRWVPGGTLPGDWATTWTLTKAVTAVERALVDWLHALGYRAKFG